MGEVEFGVCHGAVMYPVMALLCTCFEWSRPICTAVPSLQKRLSFGISVLVLTLHTHNTYTFHYNIVSCEITSCFLKHLRRGPDKIR